MADKPKNVLEPVKAGSKFYRISDACVGCKFCLDICTWNALEEPVRQGDQEVYVIEEASCPGCGCCAACCPVGAIEACEPVPASKAKASEPLAAKK
ncbi:4Fe-4S dicluster domain-containing protein [Heliophilum fasciatum]|uniref:4Fe-4S dicluster protein n=1 Tax=Heliophilum fasciatum TaxID=35700 RepID=A0A4R2S1F9_9FIRM|nr:4Fe-4S dicluster domain-containing protein [Heliophilum fasciatum]MCW2277534.1 formate hydrogenlyase subunit 6/NADH:ubiquinone oxidoreductase subunit I [Heliophilum fasciatum]TCP65175.1 4Fe-4S dicluster protein [Heliophilum fasciatum]